MPLADADILSFAEQVSDADLELDSKSDHEPYVHAEPTLHAFRIADGEPNGDGDTDSDPQSSGYSVANAICESDRHCVSHSKSV